MTIEIEEEDRQLLLLSLALCALLRPGFDYACGNAAEKLSTSATDGRDLYAFFKKCNPNVKPSRVLMNQALLVLDVHYLCHRAFHTMRELSWRGKATGVIFGFLKSIVQLKDEFTTDRVAFCFEHPHLFRRDIYPAYKRRRRAKVLTEQEEKAYSGLAIQISLLRKQYLPRIGFKNVFCFRGFESDDIMAAIADNQSQLKDEVILVTSDSDLYQCLTPHVCIYSPQMQKMFTDQWFRSKYHIEPYEWAVVKALSGCSTDEVKGIRGVGEVTALRYLRGELKKGAAYQSILEGKKVLNRNKALVQLPFEGCPVPAIEEDEVSVKEWRSVCAELGMRSLAGRPPIATRRLGG